MASLHRLSPGNPPRELGYLDHERCAALHNEILHRGWVGLGKDPAEFSQKTKPWWEFYSPDENTVARLDPHVAEFLKLAREPVDGEAFPFFYWVRRLGVPGGRDSLFGSSHLRYEDSDEDRYIILYQLTGFKLGDELGIVFDQHTSLATFMAHIDDPEYMCGNDRDWHPLEVILDTYLQMVDDGKVTVANPSQVTTIRKNRTSPHIPDPYTPWVLHHFSQKDLEKAVSAMHRLLDAIEARLPPVSHQDPDHQLPFPWSESDRSSLSPIKIGDNYVVKTSFVHQFLERITTRPIAYTYIAPGIRLPTPTEILDQLHPQGRVLEYEDPLLIFPIDGSQTLELYGTERKPGFYIEEIVSSSNTAFTNGCYLLLPFELGSQGWAKLSNGDKMRDSDVEGGCKDLYQSGYTGFTDLRSVQIHKVLENWAERVEKGDWDVGVDGVLGGLDVFKKADTEACWSQYMVPLSW